MRCSPWTLLIVSSLAMACGGDEPSGDPDDSDPADEIPDAPPGAVECGPSTLSLVATERYRADVEPADLVSLDVFAPPTTERDCARPVLIYVHGGAWTIGDKANAPSTAGKLTLAADGGYVYVSINYRLSPAVLHPSHISDVDAAVDWVRTHIGDFGGDPTRIVLMGHSAGGHLVALASTHPAYQADSICTVVIDSDQYDLTHGLEFGGPDEQAAIEQAFGTDPVTLRDGSPLLQVTASSPPPPMLVITRGNAPRIQRAQDFVNLVQTIGEAELVEAGAVSHEEVNDQLGTPVDAIATPVVADFLRSCAALSTP